MKAWKLSVGEVGVELAGRDGLQDRGRLWHILSCVLGRTSPVPRDWLGRDWLEWAKIVPGETQRCPELSSVPCGSVQRGFGSPVGQQSQQIPAGGKSP